MKKRMMIFLIIAIMLSTVFSNSAFADYQFIPIKDGIEVFAPDHLVLVSSSNPRIYLSTVEDLGFSVAEYPNRVSELSLRNAIMGQYSNYECKDINNVNNVHIGEKGNRIAVAFNTQNGYVIMIFTYGTWWEKITANLIIDSLERWQSRRELIEEFVARCYSYILGRNPDPNGLNNWATALENGTQAAANIIDGFINSQEYKNRHYSDAEAVEILYNTMLNRGSDTAGKAHWVNMLAQGNPLAVVINGFCGSQEFIDLCNSYAIEPGSVDLTAALKRAKIEAFVKRCYQIILGRETDAGGLNSWATALESGAQAASNIIDGLMNSQEFKNRRLSNGDAIEILYNAMLGRSSDAAGKANWLKVLNQGQPFGAVINGFCVSQEFRNICNDYGIKPGSVDVTAAVKRAKIEAFVKRCYQIILSRDADAGGLNSWVGALESGAQAASNIIDGFMNSQEFLNKHLSNGEAVEILYNAMLGRGSDAAGKANWIAVLDQGQPFGAVINGFCESQEFRNICNDYGIIPGSVNVNSNAVRATSRSVPADGVEVESAESDVNTLEAASAAERKDTDPVKKEIVSEDSNVFDLEEPIEETAIAADQEAAAEINLASEGNENDYLTGIKEIAATETIEKINEDSALSETVVVELPVETEDVPVTATEETSMETVALSDQGEEDQSNKTEGISLIITTEKQTEPTVALDNHQEDMYAETEPTDSAAAAEDEEVIEAISEEKKAEVLEEEEKTDSAATKGNEEECVPFADENKTTESEQTEVSSSVLTEEIESEEISFEVPDDVVAIPDEMNLETIEVETEPAEHEVPEKETTGEREEKVPEASTEIVSDHTDEDETNSVEANDSITEHDSTQKKDDGRIRDFVTHCYNTVLGRAPDEDGLNRYVQQIADGTKTPKQIAQDFICSAEFQGKQPGNEETVRVLYRLFLYREADEEGLAGWVTQLEAGTGLDEVIRGFADSDEFRRIVNGIK